MLKRLLLVLSVLVLAACNKQLVSNTTSTASPAPVQSTPSLTASTTPKPTIKPLPAKVELAVPFLVQAPNANWDALHEEACEEASLLNVLYFLQNRTPANKDAGEKEIQEVVAYEEKYGYGVSITLEQLNQIAKDFYGRKIGKVKTNITIADIKRELAYGKPVIIGAAGKILPNPHFKNGGPNYHMLVIKGYDENGTVPLNHCRRIDSESCRQDVGVFITNDVGIWQGNSFLYTYEGLFRAIHDWDANNILNGQKSYLVFE